MDTPRIARVLHVLAVVLWIGGVAIGHDHSAARPCGDMPKPIAMTINLTPRKCLGYRSPIEAFLSELGRDLEIRFA